MADVSYPNSAHNSYQLSDFEYEQLVAAYSGSGMVGLPTDPPMVYADGTGLVVKFKANRLAYVRGRLWSSGVSDISRTVTGNSSGSVRTDLAVLQLSRTGGYVINALVRAGSPGSGPPALNTDLTSSGLYEIPCGKITVANNVTSLGPGDVSRAGWFIGRQVINTDQIANIPSDISPGDFVFVPASSTASAGYFFWNGSTLRRLTDDGTSPWTSYTVAFTSNGSPQPAVGSNGVLIGRYRYLASGYIQVQIHMKYGTAGSPSAGNGFYRFSLPLPAAAADIDLSIGSAYMRRVNLESQAGTPRFLTATTIEIVSDSGPISDSIPFGFTNGSEITVNLAYSTA